MSASDDASAPLPLSELIAEFSDKSILVIGDVMLDRFIWGSVDRISPEAPVPVVRVEKEDFYPGGAANVARNLTPFAKDVYVCGLVGRDQEGDLLQGSLAKAGAICDNMVRDSDFATICKTRVIAQHQQIVRIDQERCRGLTSSQMDGVVSMVEAMAGQIDGIILEDYAKGVINEEIVRRISAVAVANDLVVTVDPNPKNPLPIQGVTAVKPNRKEAFEIAGIIDDDDSTDPLQNEPLLRVGEQLMEIWETPNVLITLGEQGMVLFSEDDENSPHHIPTRAKEVFDVSGAGDTAIALFTLALSAGHSALLAAEIANHASSRVVGKLGTATVTPADFELDV